jgi:hypothetical protein
MRIDFTRQSVMPECIFPNAPRAEVFGREHATRCHNAHKCIEGRRFRVLSRKTSYHVSNMQQEGATSETTHNTLIKRCGESGRAGHIQCHALAHHQNVLELFEVARGWRHVPSDQFQSDINGSEQLIISPQHRGARPCLPYLPCHANVRQ